MLSDAFSDTNLGISLTHGTDGSMFNIRKLQSQTKVSLTTINDILFADDYALNTNSEPSMQETVDKFSNACDSFGLTISTKKTEVLHQPAPGKPYLSQTSKSMMSA